MEPTLFLTVFSLSFVVALTGAMAPGPLLTYTIIKSARTAKRGYAMGAWVILGHAVLEAGVVLLLLTGFSFVLQHQLATKIIGGTGGLTLIAFGLFILRDLYLEKTPVDFDTLDSEDEAETSSVQKIINNPVAGGFLVSMANPYWWVWWATIGLAFMTKFQISHHNLPLLVAFFVGHEAGDLAWYLLVSALSFWGVRRLNKKFYYLLLAVCAFFMMGFGVYLGLSPFL